VVCVLGTSLDGENFTEAFKEKCFSFVDRVINQYSGKDELLAGAGYGIKLVWHNDEAIKEKAYINLIKLIEKYQKKHPRDVIEWLRLVLPYSHKHKRDDLQKLIRVFSVWLEGLSRQEVYDCLYPNIVGTLETLEFSSEAEQAVLNAMQKAESIEGMRVLDAYTSLVMQKNKSDGFVIRCLERLEALLSSVVSKNPAEAAKMLRRIGTSASMHRDVEFPVTMKLVLPLLQQIYKADPKSIKFAEIEYGSHGSDPFQHKKYVEIFKAFMASAS
jgi:hypothetical protein